MHVPSGLFIYGMWQQEENHGTKLGGGAYDTGYANLGTNGKIASTAQNRNNVWYLKGGIKRNWNPLGATVLFGEYGQYQDQYSGWCTMGTAVGCMTTFQVGEFGTAGSSVTANITGSEVDRWGLGAVQEIDSAAMHLFAKYQHLEMDLSGSFVDYDTGDRVGTPGFKDQDLFQIGGVIFF
jgi:hypothetical protein